jgi:hypothetical protein
MLNGFFQQYASQVETFSILLMLINAILHVIFAGAVARDAGMLYKIGQRPALVSAPTWAFATLLGGVFVAAIYWFIHHSNLTRPISSEAEYDKS